MGILTSTHNMYFHGEIRKIYGYLLIWNLSPGRPTDIDLQWARSAIFAAGKVEGECFYFFSFFTVIHFPFSPVSLRVRVTDRPCRHLRRKNKIWHKIINWRKQVAKKYRLNYPLLSRIIVTCVYHTFLDCIIRQLTTQLSIRKQ